MSRLPVAVLAGGLATRLGTLTQQTPKCMPEVCGRSFIHHELRQLHDQRMRSVVFFLGLVGFVGFRLGCLT